MARWFAIVAMVITSASAAERTVTWTTGENPASVLDGDVTFTYQSGLIYKATFDPKGDTIIFTGDKMNCVDPDRVSGTEKSSTWTFNSEGTVIFRNDFQARSMVASASKIATNEYATWNGYSTLLSSNEYQIVFSNAKLSDWEPIESFQDASIAPGSSTKVGWWWNRDMTMRVIQVLREGDRAFVQYRTANSYGNNSRRSFYTTKVEFKQIGDDIGARLVGGWMVYYVPDTGSEIQTGEFDLDEIDIGEDKLAVPLRVTGPTETMGMGMNTIVMKYVGQRVVMRFEGTTNLTGSPKPNSTVRMEIANASKTTKIMYALPQNTGVLSLQNCGANWDKFNATDLGSNLASVRFESTAATSSAAVTNIFKLSRDLKIISKFFVSGIDGSPAVLDVATTTALPTNSTVTVRPGGILRLSAAGVQEPAPPAFVAEPGGIIEQCNTGVFSSTNQVVRLNGGKLVVGCGSILASSNDAQTDLFRLYMRDGALLEPAKETGFIRIGGTDTNGTYWSIGGVLPSTNSVSIEIRGPSEVENPHVFNVSKTGDAEADFVQNGKMRPYSGAILLAYGCVRKTGDGTMLLNGEYTVWGKTYVDRGTLTLGKSDLWKASGRTEDPTRDSQLMLNGGTLAAKAETSNSIGKLTLAADSSIVVGEGATLTFGDAADWVSGKTLAVTIPVNPATRKLLSTVRFSNGLTSEQLAQVRLNGKQARLDGTGALTRLGLCLIIK